MSGDVLTSVRKMEESLKRLNKRRVTAPNAGKLSDDDKIRVQFQMDVAELGHLVSLNYRMWPS